MTNIKAQIWCPCKKSFLHGFRNLGIQELRIILACYENIELNNPIDFDFLQDHQISNECQMTNAKKYITQVQRSMVHGSRLTDENCSVLTYWEVAYYSYW